MDFSLSTRLQINFPGRKYQIERLFNLFGYRDEPFVDCVYLYGPSGTGKSAVLGSLLAGLEIRNAVVNLVECYSSKILFESILNQLADRKIDVFKGKPYAKCDNMMDFIFNLRKCAEQMDINKSVIVLDRAEQLRNMDCNLLAGFLRLRELSEMAISVIFVSEIVFEKYHSRTAVMEPIKIYFPQYNKEELLEILRMDFDHVRSTLIYTYGEELNLLNEDFFRNYLNLFLSVFYRACRDLSELRHMGRLNFVKYCEPIYKKELKVEDSMGLWRQFVPVLKASLEVLYLRISPVNEERTQGSREIKYEGLQTDKQFTFAKETLARTLELPFYSKYLLVAAYLASYNPAREDKRLFVKHHGKKTKRLADVKAKAKVSEKLNTQSGPKQFGFDRLIAIFYAILEEKVDFNSNLLVQISTLVELQLLSMVSDSCDLDGRKYKCCVGLEFVEIIAKTLGLTISKYLVDFN